MPVFMVIGIVFIVLKLVGVIAAWSWWLVTAPFWGGLILSAIFFAWIMACFRRMG